LVFWFRAVVAFGVILVILWADHHWFDEAITSALGSGAAALLGG